jgi:hypothetical protein
MTSELSFTSCHQQILMSWYPRSPRAILAFHFHNWLLRRWQLPFRLYSTFYFCGLTLMRAREGSLETLLAVDLHLCLSENAHAQERCRKCMSVIPLLSLSCHPLSVQIDLLFWISHPPFLALLGVFVISCSHLYDRWNIPMATTVIMNPQNELAGEK